MRRPYTPIPPSARVRLDEAQVVQQRPTDRTDVTWRGARRAGWGPWLGPLALVAGVLAWQVVWQSRAVPAYMLPAPRAVAEEWWRLWRIGILPHDLHVTVEEAALGFGLAFVVGVALGFLLARARLLSGILTPYIAASQAMPIIAFAPLLVVWFGLGLLPKVLIGALIVFFPIVINTEVGLRTIDRNLIEASWTMGASGWQTLRYVEIPLALRTLLGGVKMGLTLAMTGAVVGEFVAADAGLGYLMNFGRTAYNAPMVFAAALTMAGVAILAYAAVSLAERLLITWE